MTESKITLYMKTCLVTLFCYRVSVTTMHLGCALIVRILCMDIIFRPSYAAVSETTKVKIKKLFVKCKWRTTGAGRVHISVLSKQYFNLNNTKVNVIYHLACIFCSLIEADFNFPKIRFCLNIAATSSGHVQFVWLLQEYSTS